MLPFRRLNACSYGRRKRPDPDRTVESASGTSRSASEPASFDWASKSKLSSASSRRASSAVGVHARSAPGGGGERRAVILPSVSTDAVGVDRQRLVGLVAGIVAIHRTPPGPGSAGCRSRGSARPRAPAAVRMARPAHDDMVVGQARNDSARRSWTVRAGDWRRLAMIWLAVSYWLTNRAWWPAPARSSPRPRPPRRSRRSTPPQPLGVRMSGSPTSTFDPRQGDRGQLPSV